MNFFHSLDKNVPIFVYTDGACSGNPGPGGWGVVVYANDETFECNGGNLQTTNNRMELTACIEALKLIPKDFSITLRTDSRYVKDGILHWVEGWKKNGWKTAAKTPVKNQDLWEELDSLAQNRPIIWEWVVAHSGEKGNERADMMAKQGIVIARMKE